MPESLYCQNCDCLLSLDSSLLNLNEAQQHLLTGRLKDEGEPLNDVFDKKRFIPPERLQLLNQINEKAGKTQALYYKNFINTEISEEYHEKSQDEENLDGEVTDSNSFVLLPSNQKQEANDPKTISQRIKTLNKIFKILSNNQYIDNPLCLECSDLVLENFKLKFDQNQREKDSYLGFLRKLKCQDNAMGSQEVRSHLDDSIREKKLLLQEEKSKLEELKNLETQKISLDQELLQLEKEYDELIHGKLQSVLKLKNETEFSLQNARNNLDKYQASYQKNLDELDRLRKFNIYTEIFKISSDDNYASINNYRLGYKVPWPENNAALGQIVLLLVFLLKKFDIKLKGYKLVAMGSQSHIIKLNPPFEDEINDARIESNSVDTNINNLQTKGQNSKQKNKIVLDLHTSNEFSFGKLFNYNKLDVSMMALLEIIYQFENHLISIDPEIVFPYAISFKDHTIGNKNIRVTSNAEWTTSCKFMLTNLNWILKYSSVN